MLCVKGEKIKSVTVSLSGVMKLSLGVRVCCLAMQ